MTAAEIEKASGLALIVRAGAGVNTIDLAAASARAVAVSNCPGKNAIAVAELAWGLLLALDRRLVEQAVDLRNGVWNKAEYGKARGLAGRTLGVDRPRGDRPRGRARARRRSGCRSSRGAARWTTTAPARLGVARADSIHALAAASDVVTVHCALTKETKGMLDAKFFEAMKPGAFFVNTSRGEVVDAAGPRRRDRGARDPGRASTSSRRSRPAGAGAFEDDIVKLPGVIGTHHVGASTEQAQNAIAAETVRIVAAFASTRRGPERRQPREPHAGDAPPVRPAPRPGRRPRARLRRPASAAGINVEQTENVVFAGAEAACARIQVGPGAAGPAVLDEIRAGCADVLSSRAASDGPLERRRAATSPA